MSLISAKNLTVRYENRAVIDKLNFELNSGDFLCVVGSNGCGKSTLLKTILGLIKPDKGKIAISCNRNSIGYVPQNTEIAANFPASVEEVVHSGLLRHHKNGHSCFFSNDSKLVAEALKLLGIEKLAKKKIGELSGGQRQRVLLARALVMQSELLILDEPTNNLDSDSRTKLNALLNELNQKDTTIIVVTHDLDHDNLAGNKILNLSTHFFGTTEEYVRRLHDK